MLKTFPHCLSLDYKGLSHHHQLDRSTLIFRCYFDSLAWEGGEEEARNGCRKLEPYFLLFCSVRRGEKQKKGRYQFSCTRGSEKLYHMRGVSNLLGSLPTLITKLFTIYSSDSSIKPESISRKGLNSILGQRAEQLY